MFGIQSKQNNDSFKTASTELLEQPKNGRFFAIFNKSRKAINGLGYGGQILSGLTEFLAVYALFNNHLFGVIGGLFAVTLFEIVGLRIVLKTIVRALIRKEFKTQTTNEQGEEITKRNGYAIAEITILFIIFLSLGFGNINLSLTGNSLTFEQKKNNSTYIQLFSLDSAMNEEIKVIEYNFFKLDSSELKRIETDKSNIDKTYSSTLKNLNRSKWVEGANLLNINKSIEQKESEKLSKINKIDSLYLVFRSSQDTVKAQKIAIVTNSYQAKKEGISKSSQGTNTILSYLKNSISILLFVFMIISILSIVFEEIFFKGSDINLKTKEQRLRPNLFIEFWRGIYNRLYHLLYLLVLRVRGSINYDYKKLDANKTVFEGEKWLNDRIAQKQHKNAAKVGKTGFNIGFQGSASMQNGNSITNCGTDEKTEKKTVLSKYNISAILMQFKRSDLVEFSLSTKKSTQIANRKRYLAAKEDLQKVGVKFIEGKNSVKIKL